MILQPGKSSSSDKVLKKRPILTKTARYQSPILVFGRLDFYRCNVNNKIVFVRELQNGWETRVYLSDLPEYVQKGVEGSQKAGCHSFTWQENDGQMKTIPFDGGVSDKGRRK